MLVAVWGDARRRVETLGGPPVGTGFQPRPIATSTNAAVSHLRMRHLLTCWSAGLGSQLLPVTFDGIACSHKSSIRASSPERANADLPVWKERRDPPLVAWEEWRAWPGWLGRPG